MDKNSGMLFIFPNEQRLRFWMRDTFIPLSVAFFDNDKKLMSIVRMTPQLLMSKQQNLKIYQSERPGLFALEVNQGWFEKNQVGEGVSFRLTETGTVESGANP